MRNSTRAILAALVILAVPLAASAADRQIGFSGFLTNNAGSSPIADGPYSIIFSIYTVASGPGAAVWTETQSVTTVTGEFTVLLGSVTPFAFDFSSDNNYYLGIKVGANPEMTPRKALLYVPGSLPFGESGEQGI